MLPPPRGPEDAPGPALDPHGQPYPPGWQISLLLVRDAKDDHEAVSVAVRSVWLAPRAMGHEYALAVRHTLLARLGLWRDDD